MQSRLAKLSEREMLFMLFRKQLNVARDGAARGDGRAIKNFTVIITLKDVKGDTIGGDDGTKSAALSLLRATKHNFKLNAA
jgi:hypothetical protein